MRRDRRALDQTFFDEGEGGIAGILELAAVLVPLVIGESPMWEQTEARWQCRFDPVPETAAARVVRGEDDFRSRLRTEELLASIVHHEQPFPVAIEVDEGACREPVVSRFRWVLGCDPGVGFGALDFGDRKRSVRDVTKEGSGIDGKTEGGAHPWIGALQTGEIDRQVERVGDGGQTEVDDQEAGLLTEASDDDVTVLIVDLDLGSFETRFVAIDRHSKL